MLSVNQKSIAVFVPALFLLITLVIWIPILDKRDSTFQVHVLDVGQGSAALVVTPSGQQILIDGGAGSTVLQALAHHVPFWDRSLDVVVATHPDTDHIGGLIPVLNRFAVERVVRPGIVADSDVANAFTNAIAHSRTREIIARRGMELDFGDGVRMTILFPDRDVSTIGTNDGSIIGRISYGETSLLFTGDSPQRIEEYLVVLGDPLASHILLVGHHGSDTSSSELFLGSTGAVHAAISRGCNNRFGHPHEEVLNRLQQFEMQIYDTCDEGSISFISDGENIVVR